MSTVEQNNAPPVSAAPSQAQPVQEGQSTSHPGAAPQPVDTTEQTEEKKRQESWKILMAEAGLFSAVVTAFLIEAYQWLSEDPADTTVMLLTQISMQLNTSQTVSMFPQHPEFSPDASSIRINCWWLLSLVFSLTSALFGLLCKQWLREQQRDPPTRTPAEALALRQMRRDSFEKWGVSPFLSVLPILLEVALLFFFTGILDLLWARHPIPFTFCLVSVVLSAGLYFVTAFLPVLALFLRRKSTLDNRLGRDFTPSYHFICPYKSPQAWAVYQLLFKTLYTLNKIPSIQSYIWRLPDTLQTHIVNPASDWSLFDLRVIRESSSKLSDSFTFNIYELRAFQWAFTTFRDSPSMLPHLQNVLGAIPPSAAMSAVLGNWRPTMWGDIQKSDVELWFNNRLDFWLSLGWYIHDALELNLRDPTLLHPEGMKLLWFHQYWQALAARGRTDVLIWSIESHQADLQNLVNLRFVVPFPVIAELWTHGNSDDCQERSLRLLEGAFSTHPGYDEGRHKWECLAFISTLVKHLNRTDFTSYVATSTRGQEFIRFVDGQIISRRLYRNSGRQELLSKWAQVIQRIPKIGHQPPGYFAPIPVFFFEEPVAQVTDAAIPLPNSIPRSEDPEHEMNDNSQGLPGSVDQDEQGNAVGRVSADELNPRPDDRRSEHEMVEFGHGGTSGSVERGEQSNEVGGVGAEQRV